MYKIYFILIFCTTIFAQSYTINGVVKTSKGEMLPGANVEIKYLNLGTIVNDEGQYILTDLSEGIYILKVSFSGYKTEEKEINLSSDLTLNFSLEENIFHAEEIIVYATRANEKTPTTFSKIEEKEIKERNLGQDLPYLLKFTPSIVTTSDAGAGVGYTGMRIRGSDATRINVTINGIPLNDLESHCVYWVDMPDFASSVYSIQIQRGVGTSTNGAGAFGATVNLQTSLPSENPYTRLENSFGSFDTKKHTAFFGTGLINNHWSFEGRLSKIVSDGYIDRASSDLKSYYLSGGYYSEKTTVKALTFTGKEVTYQSWYGTPEVKLKNDLSGIEEVIGWSGEYDSQKQIDNIRSADSRTYNYYIYDNEVDDYQQDHYQLHINHSFSKEINMSSALHYTYGRGYYEQYKYNDDLADYQLGSVIVGSDTITSTDLIRRRWLDNDFYGGTFAVNYDNKILSTTLGGAYNYYDGDHFGEIIWARYASDSEIRDHYYDNYGRKSDFNIYTKTNYQATNQINLFVDLQLRMIDYHTKGIDSDLRIIDDGDEYTFFNPKLGLTYSIDPVSNVYASIAIANREPVRSDFIDNPKDQTPKYETLENLEVGYRRNTSTFLFSANYFLMDYNNQLVLTGALNDVGSPLRTNVDESYRMGFELVSGWKICNFLNWDVNLTLSRNKIKHFTEELYDWAEDPDSSGFVIYNKYSDIDISFSPNLIAGSMINYTPFNGLSIKLFSKYVSKQYLDNTQNDDRVLDAYFINDLKLSYEFSYTGIEKIGLSLLINNLFDVEYSSNGYTWRYYYGDFLYQQNNYYPQAGINFLAGLILDF